MSHCCAKYCIIWLFTLIGLGAGAQDAQFSQFYATRIYLNPAFTGNTNYGRVSSQFRRQWPVVEGYTTYGVYYDQNLARINSGIGISVLQDRQSEGAMRFNKFAGMYSYGFRIKKNFFVRTGIEASYNSFNVDLNRFTFTDQLISGAGTTTDDYSFDRIRYFDFDAGALIYSKWFWFGSSVSNLNNASRNPNNLKNPYPVKYSFHGGGLIPFNRDSKGNFYQSLALAAHYKAQLLYDQFEIGAYYGYSKLIFGVWYRGLPGLKSNNATPSNTDAVIVVAGVKSGGLRLTYSFDISASPLFTYSGGAHEVTFQLDLWHDKNRVGRKNSRKQVPCPDFGPNWKSEEDND